MDENPKATKSPKKKVRISLNSSRDAPKRSTAGKNTTIESDDEESEDSKSPKRAKKSSKKGAKTKGKKAPVEYDVEKVVDDELRSGKKYYRIRWKGYKAKDDTWEPKASLSCPDKIQQYEDSKAAADDTDYDVEKIVGVKVEYGVRYYLIKWKGWSEDDNTWQAEDTVDCSDLIDKFIGTLGGGTSPVKSDTPKKAALARGRPKKAAAKSSPKKSPKSAKSPATPKSKRGRKRKAPQSDNESDDDQQSDGDASGELITGDDDLEFEVEKIVKDRVVDDHKEYLIRWKGCKPSDDSWEHEDNISCSQILAQYLRTKKKKK